MVNKQYILDASFFIGLMNPLDPHYQKATSLFFDITTSQSMMITNQYIVQESHTVLLYRTKEPAVLTDFQKFLTQTPNFISVERLSETDEDEVLKLFIHQPKTKYGWLSFWDCSVLYQARKENAEGMVTFDEGFKQFTHEFELLGV